MANFINWRLVSKRSIYHQLNDSVLDILKNSNQDDLRTIDEKLEYASNIHSLTVEELEDCFYILKTIDDETSINNLLKLKMLITYISLASINKDLTSLNIDSLLMITAIASHLELNDYNKYLSILGDPKLARVISREFHTFDEQIEASFNIINNFNIFNKDYSGDKLIKALIRSIFLEKEEKKKELILTYK